MLAQALSQPLFSKRSAFKLSSGTNVFSNWLTSSNLSSNVHQNIALKLSAFYNGITIICNDYAKLPKGVFQKTSDGKGREALFKHPVKYIIDKAPNQYMTAYNFDFTMCATAILKGNSYAYIERNPTTAAPIALQYIDQESTVVEVLKYQNKLWYKYDGKTIPSEDMVHLPGFSFNGITGISVLKFGAQSLNVNLASQKFAGEYYEDKGVGIGVLTASTKMNDEAKTRYSQAMSAMFERKSKWVIPIIDEASNFEHIKVTPQESQFLLSAEFGINEIARWLNISPQKLKSNKDVNNSISESLERQHVSDSILPWAIKGQQEYDRKLFTEAEKRNGIYTKFNTESLLSSDKVAQADYWSKLIFSGVLTRNEVRQLLERNNLEGLSEPLTPVNAQMLEQIEAKLSLIKKQTQDVEA